MNADGTLTFTPTSTYTGLFAFRYRIANSGGTSDGLVTLAGLQLPLVFSGALVTETIFTWPGMGRLFVDSIGYRDYPVLMGILVFTAALVILGNLVADLVYAAIDPRVRHS